MQKKTIIIIDGITIYEINCNHDEYMELKNIQGYDSGSYILLVSHEAEDEGPGLYYQTMLFGDAAGFHNVEVTDSTVEKIVDTEMIEVLCVRTFFDHLEMRSGPLHCCDLIILNKEAGNKLTAVLKHDYLDAEYEIPYDLKSIENIIDIILVDVIFYHGKQIFKQLHFETPIGESLKVAGSFIEKKNSKMMKKKGYLKIE